MKPTPTPKPFARSAHFEALRTLRRKKPELYLSMSSHAKAQLELYLTWRRAHDARVRAATRSRMIDERGAHCACCGETLCSALTLDHIIPKARGGTSEPGNIQLLCLTCNSLKGSDRTDCPHADEARRLLLGYVAA